MYMYNVLRSHGANVHAFQISRSAAGYVCTGGQCEAGNMGLICVSWKLLYQLMSSMVLDEHGDE